VQAITRLARLGESFRLLLFCGSALELSRGRCGSLYYPDNVVIAVGLKDRICERYEAINCVKAANRHLLTLSLSQLFGSLEINSLEGLPWACFEQKRQVT
jgi:hypothetical protein